MINLSLKQSIELFLKQPSTEDTNAFLCIGEKHTARTPPTQKMFGDYLDEYKITLKKEPVGNHVT